MRKFIANLKLVHWVVAGAVSSTAGAFSTFATIRYVDEKVRARDELADEKHAAQMQRLEEIIEKLNILDHRIFEMRRSR